MDDIESILTDQPLDGDEQELLDEIYERFDIFQENCAAYHDHAKMTREVIRLKDPEQDAPKDEQTDNQGGQKKKRTLQLHTLKSTFNNCVADQMLNLPEAKLLPENPDRQDAVEDMQDLLHHTIYVTNRYTKIHHRKAQDFYGPGTAITEVAWDPDMSFGKGDIAILRWPVEAFLWDTQVENIQDSRAVIKVSWHPLPWFKEHFPEQAPYIHPEEGEHEETGIPVSQSIRHASDDDRAMLLEYWYRTYDASSRRYHINRALAAGHAFLGVEKDIYQHGMYPFIIDTHSTVEGSIVGEGLVTEMLPMMRYINRYADYIDTNLRMSSKARMLTRRESGIDVAALADWDRDVIEGDSIEQGRDFAWLQHAPLNGMIVNQMAEFMNDMKQDAGANQFTRGETTGGIVSGKAITALQTAGGKISQLRTSTLNDGFQEMCEQILWLMAQFYKNDRVFMVTGADNVLRDIVIDSQRMFGRKGRGAVAPPPYTVRIEVVSKDQNRIDTMNQMYMQAYTMAAQAQQYFPLSALFRLMNVEGKDQLLKVIESSENIQAQLQQAQQQIDQLTQQTEQLQKENQSLRTVGAQMSGALASIGGFTGQAAGTKAAEEGGGPFTAQAQAQMGRQRLTPEQIAQMPEEAS